MQKNEQRSSGAPENNPVVSAPTAPVVESKQPAPVVESAGSGRAAPPASGSTWSNPVSEELKVPMAQSPSEKGNESAPEADPKVEDPVTDRNGRAPNPPAASSP
jgi:hypothetical protein